ncbi:MAG TPA: pilus assembly protein PilO, partial [Roseateles sp.]|nr:pilus assembly protein PilO [Roseateles sp.]
MASKKPSLNIDLNAWFEGVADQFRGLNTNEPGQWPLLPRMTAFAVVALFAVVIGWFLLLADAQASLDAERAKEPALKDDYRVKL